MLATNEHYRYVISSLDEDNATEDASRRTGGVRMTNVAGVEGEERDDYTRAESKVIRARSLRLLGSLLRPVARTGRARP